MKLYVSPSSPFVRKVLVSAIELGLDDRLERLACSVGVIKRDGNVVAHNPLGQVPTLITDDGEAMYDSRVICEYLDTLAGGGKLFPSAAGPRFRALTLQSVADGLLDAAVLARQELSLRPPDKVWPTWREAQLAKITSALDAMQKASAGFGEHADIGIIACACALSYLEFRYSDLDWRTSRHALDDWYATFVQRESMTRTVLKERPA